MWRSTECGATLDFFGIGRRYALPRLVVKTVGK